MSKLGKMLGKGSDGEVYEILEDIDKVVKYIQPKICGIENYLEYYIMIHVNHPNIVSATEIELTEHNLVKIVQKRAISNLCVKFKNKKEIFRQLVEGVKFLNEHNILHGDIKPSNMLMFENQKVKLNDLSLCRFLDSQSTKQLYTYHYRPPEVDRGIKDLKSDVFALGCSMFEMYFNESYYDKKFQKRIHVPKIGKDKDKEFLDLIYKMTENNVEKRYSIQDVCNHNYFNKHIFETHGKTNIDNYLKLELYAEKNRLSDVFVKKCMNETLHSCIAFSKIDAYVANQLNYKIFDYIFKTIK